jgi:hypothetical protein
MAQTALIKITIDPGKGIATINGVKVALQDLSKAQEQVNKSTEENNKIIQGSLKWHQMQINKLRLSRLRYQKALRSTTPLPTVFVCITRRSLILPRTGRRN